MLRFISLVEVESILNLFHEPFGRAVMHLSLEQELRSANFGPVKSNPVLPTVHQSPRLCFFFERSCVAQE